MDYGWAVAAVSSLGGVVVGAMGTWGVIARAQGRITEGVVRNTEWLGELERDYKGFRYMTDQSIHVLDEKAQSYSEVLTNDIGEVKTVLAECVTELKSCVKHSEMVKLMEKLGHIEGVLNSTRKGGGS